MYLITIHVEPDCLLQHVPGKWSLRFDLMELVLSAKTGEERRGLAISIVSEKFLINSNENCFLGVLICPNLYRRLVL